MDRIEDYQLVRIIGRGQNCVVFLAQKMSRSRIPCAVKIQTREKWRKENRVLRQFPNCRFLSSPLRSAVVPNPWLHMKTIVPWAGARLWLVEYPLRTPVIDLVETMPLSIKRVMVIHIMHALVLLRGKNIHHHDLHFGNILMERTSQRYERLFGRKIPTYGRRFSLIDFDQALMTANLEDDMLHLIFALTNKDLVIRRGGYKSPAEVWAHLRPFIPRLRPHIDRVPFPFVWEPSEDPRFYHSLLILEILYGTLHRRADCRFRNISYTPLFLPSEDILFALRNYTNIQTIVDYLMIRLPRRAAKPK